MRYVYATLTMAAMMLSNASLANSDAPKDGEASLRGMCVQIVQDINDYSGRQVATCLPAASVKNGQPDLLMIVSKAHFAEEKMRTMWVGIAIAMAAQAAEDFAGSAPPLKAVMIDQADKARSSLDEMRLCTVSIPEAQTLLQRHQSGELRRWSEVYQNSSCHAQATEKAQ